jgi:hypothetical protein
VEGARVLFPKDNFKIHNLPTASLASDRALSVNEELTAMD